MYRTNAFSQGHIRRDGAQSTPNAYMYIYIYIRVYIYTLCPLYLYTCTYDLQGPTGNSQWEIANREYIYIYIIYHICIYCMGYHIYIILPLLFIFLGLNSY